MQSLLQLREQELETWQLKMAEEQYKQKALHNQYISIQQQIETMMDSPIDNPQNYPQRLQFIGYLRDQQGQLKDFMAVQQKVIDTLQVDLTQALAKKKTLEKLKEKQENLHIQHWQKKYQDEMEELSINRYYRNQLAKA